jgi:hypothetical protein
MSAKRASFTLAAQQCEFYLNKVIPLHENLTVAAKKMGLKSFGKAEMKRIDGGLHVSVEQDLEIKKKCLELASEFVVVMNATEAFAVHFTNGVAADAPAFESVGKTFCSTVRGLLPEVAPLARSGYYKNSMKLFAIWSARLEKRELDQEKLRIENKSNQIVDIEFESLGT